jgi:preprotein translocase subunit SecA
MNLELKQDEITALTHESLFEKLQQGVLNFYAQKERAYGEDIMRRLERYAVLMTIDKHWRDHMYEMDQLKTGIGLRAYGQRDPLIEYKREAYRIFAEMIEMVDKEIVGMAFKLQVNMPEKSRDERRREMHQQSLIASHQETTGMGYGVARPPDEANPMAEASQRGKAKPFKRQAEKVGRNDPCPCGSGKKYKKCHGAGE